jgi:hypothetical protein
MKKQNAWTKKRVAITALIYAANNYQLRLMLEGHWNHPELLQFSPKTLKAFREVIETESD